MRELKFRAWDSEAGAFTYSHIEDDRYVWGFEGGKLKAWSIIEMPGTIHEPPYPSSVELEPLDQATGLRDKNGKEIYEGDIVTHLNIKMLATDGVVHFDWGGACIKVGEAWHRLDMILREGARGFGVIGNIYENPGLLEGKP